MIESCIKKFENLKAVFTDPNFLLVKKNLREVLRSDDPVIDLWEGFSIHIPSHRWALYVVNETRWRNKSQYENLKWASSILDLWWFVWDSALFFLKNGAKSVVVCEPNYHHYAYVKRNIQKNKTKLEQINPEFECIPLNAGIVTDTSKEWECVGKVWSGINILQPGAENKVPTQHIQDVMPLGPFDWLKMDIEWGEFPIMEWFKEHPDQFHFGRWYIEFHRVYQKDYHQKTLSAIDFLENQGYRVYIHDYFGKEISQQEIIKQKKYPVVMIYFQKE